MTVQNTIGDVLIVDDEPDICWALDHLLKASAIASVTVTNGREALRLAKRHQFHLIFVDAKLSDMDGLDLARLIRKADARVRVVLVSGYFYCDDDEVRQALAADVINDFISKPFQHEDVLTIARATLAR